MSVRSKWRPVAQKYSGLGDLGPADNLWHYGEALKPSTLVIYMFCYILISIYFYIYISDMALCTMSMGGEIVSVHVHFSIHGG